MLFNLCALYPQQLLFWVGREISLHLPWNERAGISGYWHNAIESNTMQPSSVFWKLGPGTK